MRAITCNGEAVVSERDRKEPEPAPGEAVVRPTRLALGRPDVEVAQGLLGFKGVLGREFVGVVESVNPPASGKLRGKRVVGSITTICGECDLCKGGLSAHCRNQSIMGMRCRDGCFADSFAIPAANLVQVPDSVDDDHAVFALLLGSAMQPIRQITIEGKPYITVLGDGPLGLLTVQVMSHLNASVRLIGKHPEKFTLCEKWGIKHRHIDDVGRRADQDIVVDCTGSASGFALAGQLVRPRGKIIVKTLSSKRHDVGWTPIVLNEIQVIGSGFGVMSDALASIANQEVDVVSLITKRAKLADGVAAFRAADQPNVLRILMQP